MNTLTMSNHPKCYGRCNRSRKSSRLTTRLLLAVKLYETSRLSPGLAARLAGVPRSAFIFLLEPLLKLSFRPIPRRAGG